MVIAITYSETSNVDLLQTIPDFVLYILLILYKVKTLFLAIINTLISIEVSTTGWEAKGHGSAFHT